MLQDLKCAVKVLKSLKSGYVGLARRIDDGWEMIGYRATPNNCQGGLTFKWDLEDLPYYICAEFGNGRHIPLPLILGDTDEIGSLQRLALRIAFPSNRFISESALACLQDCAIYENQFEREYPTPEPQRLDPD